MADVCGLTVNVAPNVVELANLVECVAGDLGLALSPKVMEVAPQMRPKSRFAQTRHTIGFKSIDLACLYSQLPEGCHAHRSVPNLSL